MCVCVHFFFEDLSICKGTVREGKAEKDIFHLLLHPSCGYNGQFAARNRNSIGPPVQAAEAQTLGPSILHCFPEYINMKLDQKYSSRDLNWHGRKWFAAP